jgi:hypothetical protein
MLPAEAPEPARDKLERLLNPHHSLCKDDVVWLLEYIKKKVTEEDPDLQELPQPRLMQNFRYFAEVSLLLIRKRHVGDQDAERLRQWIAEAAHGLTRN